ncbi:MAG TPA: glycosyltransferase family 4 protein [Saprospiraceae bacterium]|nr:glycosyltransferase family 4 protein [Saprospiraceae bacterium]
MRILQLCKKFPYPLKDGESIAVTYLSKALRDLGCEITLLCMNTTKHYTDLSELPEDFDHYHSIHCTPLDNSLNAVDAFLNLFSDASYHVQRFDSRQFRDKLVEILSQNTYDVVQLETLYLAPYVDTIKQYSSAQIVMRAHNVEHEIWERISQNTQFFPKKWYLTHLAKKLRNYEVANLNNYDFLLALTDRDLKMFKKLGYKNGAMASPIGLETSKYIVRKPEKPEDKSFSLCFIGSLDWMPNIEGLDWFLHKVWPMISRQYPEVTLHVAGRNTPRSLFSTSLKHVFIHGEVPNASEFISRYDAMVVPLFSGSGMRVKILEGMALGKVVISTSLGKEGIEARDKEEIIVADDATAFVHAIGYCLRQPDILEVIGENARAFVKRHFNNREITQRLFEIYQQLVEGENVHA